jgi:hypothetical protein
MCVRSRVFGLSKNEGKPNLWFMRGDVEVFDNYQSHIKMHRIDIYI